VSLASSSAVGKIPGAVSETFGKSTALQSAILGARNAVFYQACATAGLWAATIWGGDHAGFDAATE
jgi:hypothetical protein